MDGAKIKVSDYVMKFLAGKGCSTVFTFAGGGAAHLMDSLGKAPTLGYISCHHEQAAAMAAEGYARTTGTFGVCLVSTGPATTNTITGVECAWNDSIPVLFISGQAASHSLILDKPLRQNGVHEANIIPIISPITKYAQQVLHARDIPKVLEDAYEKMMGGRPGPVWVDIPLDVQAAQIPVGAYIPPPVKPINQLEFEHDPLEKFDELFQHCEKPLVLIGGGAVRDIPHILSTLAKYNLPCVTTKNAFGYVPTMTRNYMGMIGINGSRKANLSVQNCDLLLVLGSRLAYPVTGYDVSAFAPNAKKIIVDIDSSQVIYGHVRPDLHLPMSIAEFLRKFNEIPMIRMRKPFTQKYASVENIPNLQPNERYVDSYYFYKELSRYKIPVLVTDQGAAFYSWSQAYEPSRYGISFTNGGFSPMGYGLPAAIGACVAAHTPVVCVAGDGGFELNIQELQTIVHHKLPVKIFVFENKGYASIRHTQDMLFGGVYVGSDPDSGLSCVDPCAIASAYGIFSYIIENDYELWKLSWAFDTDGPVIVKVILDPKQEIIPKVRPTVAADGTMFPGKLESMYPSLEDL